MESARERIRTLNDRLRILRTGGEIMITPGVASLPALTLLKLDVEITAFVEFDEANDPHGEHDFGSMRVDGQIFFFKIDAYDLSGRFGSPDAADPAVTRRVMTIMRADEY
jgi:hypothetical protein